MGKVVVVDWGSASFGAELRARRVQARLTQRELASRAGVSVRAVRYIESGQVVHPRRASARRLAEAVGLMFDPGGGRSGESVDRINIGILGPFELSRGSHPVDIGPLKQRCLLGLLALQPNKVISPEEVIDLLWGDRPPDSCQNLVHTYVSRLRKVLHPEPGAMVSAPHGGYQLVVDDDQLDLLRFDALVHRARQVLSQDPHDAVRWFQRALECWRGPLLADLPASLRDHPVAISVAARRFSVALEYADTALRLGLRQEGVVEQLRMLAREEQLHEALLARLMRALANSGQQSAALRLFADIRVRLDEELGIEPGPEITDAHLAILRPTAHLPATITAGAAEPRSVPAQLPADITGFAGRANYLNQLDAILHAKRDTAVVISAIAGTAGVGKTALAVRWAHRVRDQFPDGQLYVNLRGYAPGPPVQPLDVLARFLRALGMPAAQIPHDQEEASGLYRTELADRKMLIVLDNAVNAEQVRPLLPGNPGCLVLVTSRDRLSGLVANEGAHRLTLDVLDPAEARTLLARMIGEHRVLAEQDAAAELCAMCANLPLALRIAAAKLIASPLGSVSEYTNELRDRGRLGELTIDGDDDAVRAAFNLSYSRLEPTSRRLFRLLGLVPGPDFTPEAAAALTATTDMHARRLLGQLEAAHLVQQHLSGRYQFHDLLREYAHGLGRADDLVEIRPAIERLLDWYLHTADAATRLLYPFVLRFADAPVTIRRFITEGAALNWLESERANLIAAAVHAPDHAVDSFSWRLADALRGYFTSRGHSVDAFTICEAALTEARLRNDDAGRASTQDVLGLINYNLGNFREAIACHDTALELSRRSGNSTAEASSLHNLGRAHSNLGKPARAAHYHEQALEINRTIGNRHGEAQALSYVGTAKLSLGHVQAAMACHHEALTLSRNIGDRDAEARALHGLGLDHFMRGDLNLAITYDSDCLSLARAIGNKLGESITLITLAEAFCDAGRYQEALAVVSDGLDQARRISDRRSEIRGLDVLATTYQRLGDYGPAGRSYHESLQLARKIGYFYGESSVLIGYSAVHRLTGRLTDAAECCHAALAVIRESGTRLFEGSALTELSHVSLELGEVEQAEIQVLQALDVVREREQRLVKARALHVLGLIRQADGDVMGARSHWDAALKIFTDIGTPEAQAMRALFEG